MAACSFYVEKRQYGAPGPCQSRRGVKTVMLNGNPIKACVGHHNQIIGGGKPKIARGQRA